MVSHAHSWIPTQCTVVYNPTVIFPHLFMCTSKKQRQSSMVNPFPKSLKTVGVTPTHVSHTINHRPSGFPSGKEKGVPLCDDSPTKWPERVWVHLRRTAAVHRGTVCG